ncbi:DUF3631 domain-containing protein [Mycobacterium sp. SMC-19]|uniref:DUF3631 domain-containing protein n=1 Tax=Mycobacterium sp. SMC-19 TaxID=3381630 RepID=UPI0038770580
MPEDLVNRESSPLDQLIVWFGRFIRFTHPDGVNILALWTAHTYLATDLYTSPRLMIDSVMPGSGKTTLLDHLNRLCFKPVHAATLTSSAQLTRMLDAGPRTILLDEVDRTLSAERSGVGDLLAVLNAGYRVGATRPVLVSAPGGDWDTREMPTFAPVAMAGNSPRLPADTVSRCIRILLMPDLDGDAEDSDWELIEGDAVKLRSDIEAWTETVRGQVKGMAVDLPAECIGRSKERWRPLKRIAALAGGAWPAIADRLISQSLAEDAAENAAGLKVLPPGMVIMIDLYAVWPAGETFVPTSDLVERLIAHNPDFWGQNSSYGKALTETRFGRIVVQAAKVTSSRPGGRGRRGYQRSMLEPVWKRLRIEPGAPGEVGAVGRYDDDGRRQRQVNQLHHPDDVVPKMDALLGASVN